MDTSVLGDIGFTNAEVKVYLALLELGSSSAGPIIDKAELQNSVVHMTLHRLVDKGFVTFIKKGKIKQYHPTDPRNIVNFIEEKKRRFESILPALLSRQQKLEKQEAEVYEGFRGLKFMLYDMIKDAKKGDEYLFFSFYTKNHDDFDSVYLFYKDFENIRKKRGIITKGIAPSSIKNKFNGRNVSNMIFVDFPIPTNISIFGNKIIFTPWEDKKISFLINSRQLAESFRVYFYSIWNNHN